MKKLITTLFLYISVSFVCLVYAQGMKINPGLWQTKTITTMPFGGGTRENVSNDCFNDSEVTLEELMGDADGCKIIDSEIKDDSMQWTASCTNGGVEMLGTGQAQSTGDKISGGVDIKADVDGAGEMIMSVAWEGQRIGACDK